MNEALALPVSLTIKEAAEAVGKSPDTIRAAMKAGKIANTRSPVNGAYLTTAAALIAAGYRLRANEAPPSETPGLEALTVKIEALQAALAREGETVADLRQRLDRAEIALQAALEAIPKALPTTKRRLWGNTRKSKETQ